MVETMNVKKVVDETMLRNIADKITASTQIENHPYGSDGESYIIDFLDERGTYITNNGGRGVYIGNETISYSMIENDESLETVLITDYIRADKYKKVLNKIHSGSWIDKTFQYWIGENTKNKAWNYLKETRDVYENFAKENPDNQNLEIAYKELLIAEGSDWFWWYGEPNNSGQDYVFDYMYRERLKNVYLSFLFNSICCFTNNRYLCNINRKQLYYM